MVYNNFFSRLILSIIFTLIYILVCIYNFSYILYFIILIYSIIFIEIILYFKKKRYLIFAYLLVSLLSIYFIEFSYEKIFHFNLMIITIITFDIFSYLIGTMFGRLKFTNISPNKTVEGLSGGTFFALLFSFIFCFFFDISISFNSIFIIILIIISSFIGDLIESKFKRINNLKNSSQMLPGHGGFFDRFDSFIFSIIPYSLFNNYLL